MPWDYENLSKMDNDGIIKRIEKINIGEKFNNNQMEWRKAFNSKSDKEKIEIVNNYFSILNSYTKGKYFKKCKENFCILQNVIIQIFGENNLEFSSFANMTPKELMDNTTLKLHLFTALPLFIVFALAVSRAFSDHFFYKRGTLMRDRETLIQFRTMLGKKIKGQEKALNEITEHLAGCLEERAAGRLRPILFYLVGPSGVGKTETVQQLNCWLNGKTLKPYQRFSGSDVRGLSEFEILKTLFNYGSSFMIQIRKNSDIIAMFDEIDKSGSGLISLFQNLAESGLIPSWYQAKIMDITQTKQDVQQIVPVDASKICFFLASNETPEGVGRTGELTKHMILNKEAKTELGALELFQKWPWEKRKARLMEIYGTKRTYVERDSSSLNRFKVIVYRDLDSNDLSQIFEENFKKISFEEQKKTGADLTLAKDVIQKVVSDALEQHRGARAINDRLSELRGAIAMRGGTFEKEIQIDYIPKIGFVCK
jgi:hypothetical protein